MHLVSRLRRILAMMTVLISLLAGLGVASAQADAPILTGGGGRQTPRVAEQTPGTLPSNATDTPLPTPSPIQTTTPLNPTSGTQSSKTRTPDSAESTPTKSTEKTDNQATHVVRFDQADGSTPTQSTVKTGTLATPPQQNPVREGFRFDGWTHDGQPFDFQTPILQDTILKAQWTKTTDWALNPDHGPATGTHLTINPPNRQEPQFASVQAAGNQFVGLTGGGRIYTWTQDRMPNQVPFPAQAPDGFHYLQTAAGSRWQAALGSDQRIYIWASGQATSTILDTRRNAGFASISMHDDRLLAVDRQGQVHAFQASNAGSQDLNPKFTKQATISLPGKAQAVTAVACASRVLIVDADRQAWVWDTSNTGKAKPARIKQLSGICIVQAQTLNQGFLLLDADGQVWYLTDNTTNSTAVNLLEGMKARSTAINKDEAMIVGNDGRVWAWKPDETPVRIDNGNQQYVQAAEAGSKVIAISRQGNICRWSLDEQGQPSNPSRLDTIQASTLESASIDGQALTLSKKDDSWQADIFARKPGPVTMTLTGRQDGQTFTRSLKYTVDQPLTRDDQQDTTYTITFNADGGSPKPADQNFSAPNSRVKRPSPDPVRKGFQFDGWFIGQVAYDFSKPVTKNLILTAKWTPESLNNTWSINPDKGSQLGNESTTITPPDSASRGIRFSQVSGSKYNNSYFSLAVGSDGNAYAWGNNSDGQLGDGTTTRRTTPVMVRKPKDAPADFTYVQVSAGDDHSLAVGSDGNAYAWGNNGNGLLGGGTSGRNTTPVMVRKPKDAPADFTYVQISAGSDHTLALGSDGNAYAWGYNWYGQLGDGTENLRFTQGMVKKPKDAPTDFTYVQISAGRSSSLALGSDGNAYAWGIGSQLCNGTNTDRTTPGMVKKPDSNTYPDRPADFTYSQVSAGGSASYSLTLGSDGYAYAWSTSQLDNGDSSSLVPTRVRDPANPTDASKGLKATQVSAGTDYSLVVGSDGYAYAWGNNYYGKLGSNSSSYNSSVPVHVRDPANPTDASKGLKAAQVSAGSDHTLAVGSDGYAYAWGYNWYGQLGNDSIPTGTYRSQSPVPVPVVFNLTPVITGVRFDQTAVSSLMRGDGSSVTVTTPAHQPGTVTVSVDYTLGGAPQTPDTSLKYTYLPAGVLPKAGGEGILLALATGMTGMGGVLASRRHRKETHSLSHASLE